METRGMFSIANAGYMFSYTYIIIKLLKYIFYFDSMTESVYRPRQCAFHPKETIFNFCKNS